MTRANHKRAMIDINYIVGLLRGSHGGSAKPPKETNNNEHKQSIHNRRYTLKDTLRREDNVVNNFVLGIH